MFALRLNCSTAALNTSQKVLSNWILIAFKILDFSYCMRTGISILALATVYVLDCNYNVYDLALSTLQEFTEMFNHHIKKLSEQGVIKKIISQWLPPPVVDFEKKASVLGYENLSFPFMLLAVGIMTASIVLVAETLALRHKDIRRQQMGRSEEDLVEQNCEA